jgi:cytochrome c oxidase subunit 2
MIYRLIVASSAFVAFALAPAVFAEGEDLARGEALYKTCTPCHGSAGEGTTLANAPSIAGLAQWYVESQLTKFQTGVRGAHPDDLDGLRMRPMSRALFGEQATKDVAAYVASMKPVASAHTVEGDADKGKTLYTPCIACHGPQGQGNPALNGSPLTNISDWYLVTAIEKFKNGQRGGDAAKDPTAALMRPMAMTLASDEAVRDVVAYIRTLGN